MLDPDILSWRYQAGDDDRLFRDLREVREIIEPNAARIAALRATPEEQREILEFCQKLDDAAHGRQSERYIEIDQAFHLAILHATRNELLIQLGDAIQIALRYSRQLTASIPDNAVAAMPLHWKIAREIEAKHSSCADLAMRALLKKTTSDIEQELATVKIDRESVSAKGESLELSSNSNY